ncbi:hypothetical protein JKP88DRAFT_297774 [Tribonema minus]|uniref:MYND-type domain-containing protein n=1 Tax=Tribonema minus TaxID=303371 RepID=A0A835Z3P7_9STRA|nr:hypothetical protein JKP88DRAFT_256232 [Tribonema minus]KAG5182524.1 hypothetical protein JKP88DRAFT_318680 [Tribonema minus]KAG5190751.1 hypothetical protein JKP88DRAFT_297774 [Tribonema minus]
MSSAKAATAADGGSKKKIGTKELEAKVQEGLDIVQQIETGRADGMVFHFEGDLLFELSGDKAVAKAPPGLQLHKCQKPTCENTETMGGKPFNQCSGCGSRYCCRECQVSDWKSLHKPMCAQLKALSAGAKVDKRDAVSRTLSKVRLYLCPFAVCHGSAIGPGFVFVQSPNSLLELNYMGPVTSAGRALQRSLVLHYMSPGEFVEAVMQDDFELMTVRTPLEAAIAAADAQREVVVLMRARCGYICVVTMPLVPEIAVCRALAGDYEGRDALQLNLDEH